MSNNKILHKRSLELDNGKAKLPTSSQLDYGELAINYIKDDETISLKNSENEIVEFKSKNYVDDKFEILRNGKLLKFYCIEPVTVITENETTSYEANSMVSLTINSNFTIETTSNKSIYSLSAWPGTLNQYYEWLEGVNMFDGILFDMNNEDMYIKWNQGHQGQYHVQFAQYKNCIFWSDLPYISDVAKRTNYTLYYTSELPLCYSTIPENTFKAFYFAYCVTNDPNWSNPQYRESFAAATWATQVFSYYGAHSIGIFEWDSSQWNIILPKDCRGLCYDAPNIRNLGILDAINTTNFGAKSGSWRDAFSGCACLENLYIKNLKTSINVSWSPISIEALTYIIEKAINTSKITISVSPYTYYRIPETLKTTASEKNIVIELINNNSYDDIRFNNLQETKQDIIEDIDTIRNNANLGATALQSIPDEYLTETEMKDFEINGGEY